MYLIINVLDVAQNSNKGTFESYKKENCYIYLHTHFFKPSTLNHQTNTKIN